MRHAAVRHEDGLFAGVRGARIYYQAWLPDGEPRAVLLLVHGLAEHAGRYKNLVSHFVPRGYAVHGIDHLGHGRSDGKRVYVRRFADFTDTLRTYVERLQARHPEVPLFLIGHSLGALIAAILLIEDQTPFAGAVLSGPLTQIPDHVSPIAVIASRILSVLVPKMGVAAVDATGVSRDPAVVQGYLDDPLVTNGKTTARLGAEMLRAIQRLTAEASRITLPVLILQGTEDRLVDPSAARHLHAGIASPDKTLKLYPGLHHEIYNEPEHEQVLRDVKAWMERQLLSES